MVHDIDEFKKEITEGYTFKKDFIVLGTGILDENPIEATQVKIPLKTLNRHGLIAGATGTGKTKTLQVLAEQMSLKGIPTFLMDLKGDLSGLAKPGSNNDHIKWRQEMIGLPYEPQGLPVEFYNISGEKGSKMRATVSEFGPILFSKILELNETQQGIMAVVFKYCDDNELPLLDLKDLKKTLQYLTQDGKAEFEEEYGRISPVSVSTIVRKIIEIEQQGADLFFGERSFDVEDLLHTKNGKGVISVMRLANIQDKPKLFSTFMLSLLAEIYSTFPEQGDSDKPKLCLFIDEAHLVFKEASDALLDQLESIIKLIRSKGVGIYFCTQNPTDIPDAVLSQLGLKIQHALRAFTAKDRRAIKQTAENYPLSDFYKTDKILTSLGIGEALVTVLNEKGIPTPLAATLLQAPITRMDILTDIELDEVVSQSELVKYYNEEIDRESAFEILSAKMKKANNDGKKEELAEQHKKAAKTKKKEKEDPSFFETASKNTMVRQVGRTLFRELARGLLGALGISGGRRKGLF